MHAHTDMDQVLHDEGQPVGLHVGEWWQERCGGRQGCQGPPALTGAEHACMLCNNLCYICCCCCANTYMLSQYTYVPNYKASTYIVLMYSLTSTIRYCDKKKVRFAR